MTDMFSERDLRAAFQDRAAGAVSSDLFDRIEQEVAVTKQLRRPIVLPGLGLGGTYGQLGWAAVVGAATLALVGSLVLGGGGSKPGIGLAPSSPPPATPPPSLGAPITRFAVDSVVVVSAAKGVTLSSAPDQRDALATVPARTSLFIVAGPTVVNATDWYQVKPFSESLVDQPLGWVAGQVAGEMTLAAAPLTCPSGDLSPAAFLALGPVGALACFGNDTIRMIGRVDCDMAEVARDVRGPYWLSDGRFCRFVDSDGEPMFELFGMPWDELPPDWRTADIAISGHLDDPLAADCTPASGRTLSEDDAVLACRTFFVVSRVTAVE
jgi:hypothetical protein